MTISIDIRTILAEELAELLEACGDLLESSPNDPRLDRLRRATKLFTYADPFEVPLLTPSNN